MVVFLVLFVCFVCVCTVHPVPDPTYHACALPLVFPCLSISAVFLLFMCDGSGNTGEGVMRGHGGCQCFSHGPLQPPPPFFFLASVVFSSSCLCCPPAQPVYFHLPGTLRTFDATDLASVDAPNQARVCACFVVANLSCFRRHPWLHRVELVVPPPRAQAAWFVFATH
jgi:hypothetical protein